MLGAAWNVHLRVPPGSPGAAAAAAGLARAAGWLLDEEVMSTEPLRARFAYLRKHEAERLFRALRAEIADAVVWIEREEDF